MVERTSTGNAPWTLIEANDKNFARVKILRTLCGRLDEELSKVREASASKKAQKPGKTTKKGKGEK